MCDKKSELKWYKPSTEPKQRRPLLLIMANKKFKYAERGKYDDFFYHYIDGHYLRLYKKDVKLWAYMPTGK